MEKKKVEAVLFNIRKHLMLCPGSSNSHLEHMWQMFFSFLYLKISQRSSSIMTYLMRVTALDQVSKFLLYFVISGKHPALISDALFRYSCSFMCIFCLVFFSFSFYLLLSIISELMSHVCISIFGSWQHSSPGCWVYVWCLYLYTL